MYSVQVSGTVVTHSDGPLSLLRDSDPTTEIDAQVASGDCLITVASSLDDAAELLASQPEAARPQLEQSIRTLLYLQRRYKLVRKTPDHRQ